MKTTNLSSDQSQQRLSVVTYNILADSFVKKDRYPHSSPEALDPVYRRERLFAELETHAADVYCLQEVEPLAFEAIAGHLGDAYVGHFARRCNAPDGLAIFAKARVVQVESNTEIREPSLLEGELVALVAGLRFQNRSLTLACTHLRWRRDKTPDAEHTGMLQLRRVLQFFDALECDARLLVGDFNANSQSRIVEEACGRGFAICARAQRPWDTTNINGRRRKIDYALHTPHLEPFPGRLPRLERDTPMPSAEYSSDHLPLQVGFEWR